MKPLEKPSLNPTPIFEFFRGSYGTELLVAATNHFNLFDHLTTSRSFDELKACLDMEDRPLNVLLTAMRAMGFVGFHSGNYFLHPMAEEHLVNGSSFDVTGYLSLAGQSAGVLEMVKCLKTNKPIGSDDEAGAAFIFNDDIESSAMDKEESAQFLTRALMGRAKNVAPYLAEVVDLSECQRLLDVGGGTGIYSIGFLRQYPHLKASVLDHPNVLKLAGEFAQEYEVSDRLSCVPFDMFKDEFPEGDVVLLSNILHDWDIPGNIKILKRCASALSSGNKLLIHDVFLNDELDGPLEIALYSASLFSFTEGRAYSVKEYSEMLEAAGFKVVGYEDTLIHCGVLIAEKV